MTGIAMDKLIVALAYLVTLVLVLGGLACLYVGYKLVSRRTKAATARTEFSGTLGKMNFSIGAGSAAGLAVAVSVLWIGAALWSRPRAAITYDPEKGVSSVRVIASGSIEKSIEESEQLIAELASSIQKDRELMPADQVEDREEKLQKLQREIEKQHTVFGDLGVSRQTANLPDDLPGRNGAEKSH